MGAHGQAAEPLAAILARLRGVESALARRMAADERVEIRSMPEEIRSIEFPFTARSYYVLAERAIAEGRPLDATELEGVRQRGRQRALEDFPLHLFVHNWVHGGAVLWDAAVGVAQPDEGPGLAAFGTALFEFLDQTISAGIEAFTATRAAIDAHDRGDAGLAARMLLDGQDASAVAHERGVPLASRYDVLAVALEPTPEELSEQAAAGKVAGRRKLLRIAASLQRGGHDDVLVALDAHGGHVLVPRQGGEPGVDHARCRRVVEVIAEAAGGVTATAAHAADLAGVPEAADAAGELLDVARTSRLGPGYHPVDGLALQFQASRAGVARDHLLSVLDRLHRHPEVIDTIDRLLALDGDRGRTARALGVHPNTINNRLAKARELLGFDPTTTTGMVTMYAALAARRVADGQERDRPPGDESTPPVTPPRS